MRLPASRTEGGPAGGLGSRTVTGGATTSDGRVAALRTYTDGWLFGAPDGDLVAALGRPPVQVPLPGEPQGEAIAFDGGGGLLSGSESRHGVIGELRVVPAAEALVRTSTPSSPGSAPAPSGNGAPGETGRFEVGSATWLLGAAVSIVAGGAVLLARRRRRP